MNSLEKIRAISSKVEYHYDTVKTMERYHYCPPYENFSRKIGNSYLSRNRWNVCS